MSKKEDTITDIKETIQKINEIFDEVGLGENIEWTRSVEVTGGHGKL